MSIKCLRTIMNVQFFLKMLLADIWKMTDNQQILACLNCMLLLAFSLKQATWRSDLGMSSMALTFFLLS